MLQMSDWLVNSTDAISPAGQSTFYCVMCSMTDFKYIQIFKEAPKILTRIESFMMMICRHAFSIFFWMCVVLHSVRTRVSISCFSLLLTVNNTVIILGVLTFALQLCLVLFILLRCWQLDNRIKAAFKSPGSVNKPTGEHFILYGLPVWLELGMFWTNSNQQSTADTSCQSKWVDTWYWCSIVTFAVLWCESADRVKLRFPKLMI